MSFLIENRIKTFQYMLIWVLYAFCHTLSLYWLLGIPLWALITDAFIHAALYGVLGVLLWNVLSYGNYDKIPVMQLVVNYCALAMLCVGIWVGLGYGLDYIILGGEITRCFIPALPLYIFLGLLLFIMNVFYFQTRIAQIKQAETVQQDNTIVAVNKEEDMPVQSEAAPEFLERIAVKVGHKINVIMVPDIIYLQADGDYVQIHTAGGKYLKEQTMKYLQDNLPAAQFVRVHRSFIVNIEYIARIEQYEKQNQLLTLKNGDKIKVSIAGYKLLKSRLGL